MLLDDLGDIFGHDLAVDSAVGIDHNGGADGAEADRAAFGEDAFAHRIAAFGFLALAEILLDQKAVEFLHHFPAADLGAGFARADEDLPLYRGFQHRCELFQLFAVSDKFGFCHYESRCRIRPPEEFSGYVKDKLSRIPACSLYFATKLPLIASK